MNQIKDEMKAVLICFSASVLLSEPWEAELWASISSHFWHTLLRSNSHAHLSDRIKRDKAFGKSLKFSAGNCGWFLRGWLTWAFYGYYFLCTEIQRICNQTDAGVIRLIVCTANIFLIVFFLFHSTPCSKANKWWFHWIKLCSERQGIPGSKLDFWNGETLLDSPFYYVILYNVPPTPDA